VQHLSLSHEYAEDDSFGRIHRALFAETGPLRRKIPAGKIAPIRAAICHLQVAPKSLCVRVCVCVCVRERERVGK